MVKHYRLIWKLHKMYDSPVTRSCNSPCHAFILTHNLSLNLKDHLSGLHVIALPYSVQNSINSSRWSPVYTFPTVYLRTVKLGWQDGLQQCKIWHHVDISYIDCLALTNVLSLRINPLMEYFCCFDRHGNQEGRVRKQPVEGILFFCCLQAQVKCLIISNWNFAPRFYVFYVFLFIFWRFFSTHLPKNYAVQSVPFSDFSAIVTLFKCTSLSVEIRLRMF